MRGTGDPLAKAVAARRVKGGRKAFEAEPLPVISLGYQSSSTFA
jgi:hypothetical protein